MNTKTTIFGLVLFIAFIISAAMVVPMFAHAQSYGDDFGGGTVYADDFGWGGTSFADDYGWGTSYADDYSGCYGCGGYTNDCGCDIGYNYDSACGCYDNSYDYTDTYYDDTCECYEYGSSGSSGSYGSSAHTSMPSYSSSGYSMVRPMTFGSPNYSTPNYYAPAHPVSGGSNITNTTVTNTNIDNSINDSFNNYNSNNTVVTAPLSYATPQYPVVYTSQQPYCEIRQAQASGSGVTAAYLSWTSTNATSAYLTNVGSVPVNGSQTVWPTNSMTYTLTVYGANGQSAQCSTTISGYSAPYVSLTQIPYTGFDFGTFGNAVYWFTLAAFALGLGYLAVYYIPTFALAGVRTQKKFAPAVAQKAPVLVEKEMVASKVVPIIEAIRRGTMDTMAIIASKDGSMPKIVISRN